jgi:hypothetical protein
MLRALKKGRTTNGHGLVGVAVVCATVAHQTLLKPQVGAYGGRMPTKRPEPEIDMGVDVAESRANQLLRQDDDIVTWGEYRRLLHVLGQVLPDARASLEEIDPGSSLVD